MLGAEGIEGLPTGKQPPRRAEEAPSDGAMASCYPKEEGQA